MSDTLKDVLVGAVIGAFTVATFGIGALGTFGAVAGQISLITGIGAVGTAVAGAIAGGALAGSLSLLKPKIPELSTEFGREIHLNGDPLAPRKICYGETWTGGTLRWWGLKGDNNEDIYLIIVLAGHEIDSVQDAEFTGDTLTLDGSGNVTAPSKWVGLMNVRYYLGTDAQTADATLVSEFTEWTTDHRLRGLAYAIVKLTFDEEDLNSIPQMRFKIRGRKVYDPRKDSTNGGTGLHRLADPTTWEWSRNAALCEKDFQRSPEVNGRPIAGLRVSDTRIDWANVIAEANVCDEDVTLDAGGTQDRYTVDGFIDPRQDHGTNLRHFELAMAGDSIFADGKWRLFAGAFRSPTLHLEDKHFIGPLQHQVHKGEAQRVDTAQGAFASASDSGETLDYPPVSLSSAVVGEERIFPLNFQLVSDGARVQRCAKLLLEREAAGKRITCTTNLYGYRAVPGETIEITHAAFGLTAQDMRVLDVQLTTVQVDDNKVGVVTNLVLEAGPASLYTWNAEETAIAAVPTIPQAQVPFELSFPDLLASLTNELINPEYEFGDVGWTIGGDVAEGSIVEDPTNARLGSWCAKAIGTGFAEVTFTNNKHLQVEAGNRLLVQAFFKVTAGTGVWQLYLLYTSTTGSTTLQFIDDVDETASNYTAVRKIVSTPIANPVSVQVRLKSVAVDADFVGFADGAYLAIMPNNGDVTTGWLDDEAVNEVVNLNVAGATIAGSAINAAPGFFSESTLAQAQWQNNTGETVDVRIEYSGVFATEIDGDTSGTFYSVWGEYDTGGADTDDGQAKLVVNAIEPEYTGKAGSFVASVADAATLSARIKLGTAAPSGVGAATDFYHDGMNVTVQAVKR